MYYLNALIDAILLFMIMRIYFKGGKKDAV